jgi:polar amino acid transport system substrate-binding protein
MPSPGYRRLTHSALIVLLIALGAPASAAGLLIGVEDDWFPYSAVKEGVIQGMSVDIVTAAFAATHTEIELRAYPYARCMHMALNGELLACFNTAPDARIANDYLLPKTPLFSDDILLWARANNSFACRCAKTCTVF